ncbi:hypothetical protein GAY31_19175 [Azospirillum brasilense]|nr:hypothetical protein [Azospirillum brasilense]
MEARLPLIARIDPMALTAIGLCSRALIKIGATAITAFDEGTAEAVSYTHMTLPTQRIVTRSVVNGQIEKTEH